MEIQSIIFNFLQKSAHNWARYWVTKEMQGFTFPGEYIEIRSHFISGKELQDFYTSGFEIDRIRPYKEEANCLCEVLLKRDLNYQYQNKAENE